MSKAVNSSDRAKTLTIHFNPPKGKIHSSSRIKSSQSPFHLSFTLGRYFSHSCMVGQLLHQIQAAVRGVAVEKLTEAQFPPSCRCAPVQLT